MKRIAILGLLLAVGLTGCKTKETVALDWKPNQKIHAQIIEVIQDVDRQQAMLVIMDSFDAEMKSIADAVKAQRSNIMEANANYDTTRAELETMYAELNGKVGHVGDAAKKYSFELRKHCNEAEWTKIFANTKTSEIKYF